MTTTVLDERRPVARTRHRCEACEGIILPGDRYYVQTNVYDGDLCRWKLHESCQSLYWAMHRDAGLWEDEGVDPGDLRDVVLDLFRWMTGAAR